MQKIKRHFMMSCPKFYVPIHFPFANASDHLIFTSHQLSAPHHPHIPISIYTPAPINRLQDYCSPIDKFKIISKFVKSIPDFCSHSPKSVRLTQTPHIPFGSSPCPRRHTASIASESSARCPLGTPSRLLKKRVRFLRVKYLVVCHHDDEILPMN